jgi:hypothetical protein
MAWLPKTVLESRESERHRSALESTTEPIAKVGSS